MAEEKGVWRTVRGRRIWIGEGQDLYDAMQKSGKFKNLGKRGTHQVAKRLGDKEFAQKSYDDVNHIAFTEDEEEKYSNKYDKKSKFLRQRNAEKREEAFRKANVENYKPKHNTKEVQRVMKNEYKEKKENEVKDVIKRFNSNEISSAQFSEEYASKQDQMEVRKDRTDNFRYLKDREKQGKLDYYEEEALKGRRKEIEDYRLKKGINKSAKLGKELDDKNKERAFKEFDKQGRANVERALADDAFNDEADYAKEWLKNQDSKVNRGPFNTYAEEREAMQQKKALENPQDKNKVVFKQRDSMYGGEFEYTQEEIDRMAKGKIRPMKDSYGHRGAWEGINRGNYSNKEIGQKVNDFMKKEHPGVKLSRSTSGYNNVEFRIMSSDKPLTVSEADIDKMNFSDFGRLSASNNFEWWAKDNIPGYTQRRVYSIDDVRRYAKTLIKDGYKGRNVSHDDWYLTEYGKKVVSDLQTELDSYNYDDSNGMVDYFNSGFYDSVSLGTWSKPYQNGNVSKKQATIDNYKRRKGK